MDPYEFACATVREAGDYLRDASKEAFSVGTKGGNARDIITSLDHEVNTRLIKAICTSYPTHRIYSEEGEGTSEGIDEQWVIDPIDGSSNFSRGIPHYAISLGLMREGIPVIGAIYNPVTQELFSFEKGRGAFLNDSPLSVSPIETLSDAQVIFAPGSRSPALFDWAGKSFRLLLEAAKKRGMYGSSALDICFIAAGRADAGVYGTLSTLDIAPAIGLLQEAGGIALAADGAILPFSTNPQKAYFGNSASMAEELRTLLES
jgi:myo-inositol-1(or 4)-monophosphatase